MTVMSEESKGDVLSVPPVVPKMIIILGSSLQFPIDELQPGSK
jgi:hypothetical protein